MIDLSGNRIQGKQRLLSLDVMRGLIMILLAAESCQLYESLYNLSDNKGYQAIIGQFYHHPWHGLHLWDLVQPAFMLMAGAAMYLSWNAKRNKGISWSENFRHVLFRSLRLFIAGTALHCVYAGKPVWELWNVLTQLSATTLIAYLIIQKSIRWQLICSFILLLLTELLYHTVLLPGFNEPFTEHHNFGAWLDIMLMGKINPDGWVAVNILPTAAHTIWGVLAGKLLASHQSNQQKLASLILAGAIGLLVGYTLDIAGITPIIKRISTSSFVLVSGSWVLLLMALLYWLIDIKQKNKQAWIFTVTGMNAIFIYLFFETVGYQWLNGVMGIFVKGLLYALHAGQGMANVISALATLCLEWYICYWLYKKKIFFKI